MEYIFRVKFEQVHIPFHAVDKVVPGWSGEYVPEVAAKILAQDGWQLNKGDTEVLSRGPGSKGYWDAWGRVLKNATCSDVAGRVWKLYHSDSLYCYHYESMTNKEKLDLFGGHIMPTNYGEEE